jgi:outer membrane protein
MKYISEILIENIKTSYFYSMFMLFIITSVTQANQQTKEPITEKTSLSIGAGLMLQDKPLKGVGTKVYPLPFYMYRDRAFSMRGLSASYEIFSEETWSFGGLARFRTDGYDSNDSSDLDGMSDRKNTLDVGTELWFGNSHGKIGFDWLTDVLGKHNGHEVRLTYVKPFRAAFGIKELNLRPILGLSWRSTKLNNYYFGVRADEVLANRAFYKSGNSINPYIGVSMDYQLNKRWSIFSLLRNEWLADEITNSPIIDQNKVNSIILGLVYHF